MADPSPPAAGAVESPGAFASRVVSLLIPSVDLLGIIDAIAARDAAVRREALREAADWLARCVPDEPTERNEWQQVLVEAADSLCAIAGGAPKGPEGVTIPTLATGGPDG